MQLMHVTDWLPTLYTAAGGNPEDLKATKLDGVDQWDALVQDKPSRRDKALLFIDEVRNVTAVRSGQWKLVSGTVCSPCQF
jgi:arylsulfatase A-like enzyme